MWSTRRSPQRKQSRLDLIVAGSKDGIVMVEAGANEVSEEEVIKALEAAHAAIKRDRATASTNWRSRQAAPRWPSRVVTVDETFHAGHREHGALAA